MGERAPIDIDVLTRFLISLQSLSQDLVQHLGAGQKLCHYTGIDGAIGIIGGGDLWLTNSRYSNDDEELDYGHGLVDSVLEQLLTEPASDSARLRWLRKLRDKVQAARGDQVYVCCFCETDDLLSQWRGYAENGGGFSIEFDPAGFTAMAGPDCSQGLMRLWKVFYDPHQQQEIVRACINYPYWPPVGEDEQIRFVVDALQFFMPTFKNAAFREEQERRLIFTPDQRTTTSPSFRRRGGVLVPYFSLRELSSRPGRDLKLSIKGLLVGPGPRRLLNVESARLMLAKHGHQDVPVRASTTPYRG